MEATHRAEDEDRTGDNQPNKLTHWIAQFIQCAATVAPLAAPAVIAPAVGSVSETASVSMSSVPLNALETAAEGRHIQVAFCPAGRESRLPFYCHACNR